MNRFRKKPVVVEAFQMTVERRNDNRDWPEWLNRAWQGEPGEGTVWIDADDPQRQFRLTREVVGQRAWRPPRTPA